MWSNGWGSGLAVDELRQVNKQLCVPGSVLSSGDTKEDEKQTLIPRSSQSNGGDHMSMETR